MKKIYALMLSAVILSSLFVAGCAKDTAAKTPETKTETSVEAGTSAEEKKNLYFVSLKTGGAAWGQAQKGFEDAIAELGWEGHYVAPTTANDTSQMANLFETALTNGADGILGCFYSKDVFSDVVKRANDDGVYVGSTNVNMSGEEDFWIGTDQEGAGRAQAEALIEIVGDKQANVVYMVMDLSNEASQRSYNAFVEAVKGHDNIKVHGLENDENNPITAADKMNNLVKADPTINAVICNDSSGASLGVANFIEENNLQDTFYTVGIDASADILNYVKSGALDVTLDQDFYTMGYQGVYMMKTLFEGGKLEYANDSGMIKVNLDNLVEYAAKKGVELSK